MGAPIGQPAEKPEHAAVALARATAELARAGIESPRADAELLAAYVLGVPRVRLALIDELTPGQAGRLDALVSARADRVPLQHLLGRAAFRHIELAVGPGVFVPRPETELLAGWGIEAATALPSPIIVDLCSGSGAIALAVAHELPRARVYAVERSPEALAWLRRNAAERAAAGDPSIEVVPGDVADPGILAELTGTVDVVLCNPPYVPDAAPVPPEVADHDPAEAVFGGPDGLAVIRDVVALAARLLRDGGRVGIEHDDAKGGAVLALLRAGGRFTDAVDAPDLAGRPRYATAVRAPWQTSPS